jgi:hypothetical protein
MARPMINAPSPITTSSASGAPVEAREEALAAAVATVGVLSGDGLETKEAGTGVAADEADPGALPADVGVTVEASVVGCGHEESALPPRAA